MSTAIGGSMTGDTGAPAPAAPPSPSASSSGPISLSDAFSQAGVGIESESAAAPTPPSDQPAPAIAEPSAAPVGTEPGEPPKDRWPEILNNQRDKARKDATEAFQQQYGEAITFAEKFNANPVATAVHLLQQLQQHPEYGPALRSEAGRLLAAQRQRAPQPPAAPEAVPEPPPDVRVQYEDGTEGRSYSPEGMRKWSAWYKQQLKQEFGEQFAPLTKLQEKLVKAQEFEQQTATFVENAKPLLEELKAMPGFADHLHDIATKQQALFAATPAANPVSLWFRAYREVVPAKLQAKQHEDQRTAALEASAGRSVNPAQAAPTGTMPKDLRGLMQHFGVDRV